jgi:hypothetical protein
MKVTTHLHHYILFHDAQSEKTTVYSESRCALTKVLELMSTSVYTGLNPFNFIRKHFLQICLLDVSYERSYCSF